MIKTRLIFIVLLFCLYCDKAPNLTDGAVELKSDFSETEFKNAIIGKWQSVYEKAGEENVKFLELSEQGDAKLTLARNGIEEEFQGNYSVDFLRPPAKGMQTFAELTIITLKGNIVLSRVNFDFHNALPVEAGPFLRIDEPPYGVLKKMQ